MDLDHLRARTSRITNHLRRAGGYSLAACAVLAACGDDAGVAGPSVEQEVEQFLASLPSWAEFAPPVADSRVSVGREAHSSFVHSEMELETFETSCTMTPYTLIRTPEAVAPDYTRAGDFWLGGLFNGATYREPGDLRALGDSPRAPLTIHLDVLGKGVGRTVDPTRTTVDDAIAALVGEAISAGYEPQDVLFEQTAGFSIPQALLDLGLSTRFITNLSLPTPDTTMNTVVATYYQPMFTSSIERPRTPGGLFSDAFTARRLEELVSRGDVGPDNPPVYISDVAWGRMVIAAFSSPAPREELQAALQASFDGTLTDEQIKLLGGSRFEVLNLSDGEEPVAEIRNGTITEWFRSEYASLEDARPVFHTIRSLSDGSVAEVSEAVSYEERSCVTEPVTAHGGRYLVRLDKLELVDDRCETFPDRTVEVYYNFDVAVGPDPTGSSRLLRADAVGLKKGEFLQIDKEWNFILRPGLTRIGIEGWARDADPGGDFLLGTWDLGFNFPISLNNEGRFWTTPDADGCRIRFYVQFELDRYLLYS